ncbi:AAA family ATPase [Polynucleobacter sp. MWH-HuK1]|uniref:AAA family ATPase n=1 Tax=Polynucleobacter sp. MWH-HuK1 TaxID=1743158 RepID=UPI001C0B32F0|nr:AAA family ATPase [Polynucleobacter sp. MWH-HuK1]MBU3564817.1 AAA family ATPase [Polynucleobacter sp. MWH-HuK1]
MNTNYKYRPKTIDEFVFATPKLETQIKRYADGKSMLPLVLHGEYGTGKSLLAELIPKAIDGDAVSINYVNAEELNSAKEVREKFFRSTQYDRLFSTDGQKNNYTVVEEVNFDPKAKGALRVCLDGMAERELFIFTTNEVEKIDRGLLSRAEVVEVLPAPPDRFFNRAQHILRSEGVDLDDSVLRDVLDTVYENDYDNRAYYRALDEIIEAWKDNTILGKGE